MKFTMVIWRKPEMLQIFEPMIQASKGSELELVRIDELNLCGLECYGLRLKTTLKDYVKNWKTMIGAPLHYLGWF